MARDYDGKKVLSWALYDWANSAFATTVMAGFFPLFFKEYWSAGADAAVSTFHLGAANSFAGILVGALAPVLGAIADKGSARKKLLFFFAAAGVVMTGSLSFVGKGHWGIAAALYILATVGFSGGNIFYDSLIMYVAEAKKMDFVSALGFALGYLGGGILFALNVAMATAPQMFGLENASEAVRVSFLSVALWWGLFSIPLFLFVAESGPRRSAAKLSIIKEGFRELRSTLQEIRKLRQLFLFLIGYWLYIDGVGTIIRMAVDYGMSLGFDSTSLIVALLITQFVGFPAALAFGKIGEKAGAKKGILIGLGVYIAVAIWGMFMKQAAEFYILAVAIGLVQGGVQSLSRSFYARLIPKESAAQFFGFYNMLGKFAALLGPFLVGWVSMTTGNPRYSLFPIIALFLSGAAILYCVDEETGHEKAVELRDKTAS